MQVYNVVKFKVKAGEETAFLDAHRNGKAKWPGLERGVIIKTGEQTFCLIGTWTSQEALRPGLEDIGQDVFGGQWQRIVTVDRLGHGGVLQGLVGRWVMFGYTQGTPPFSSTPSTTFGYTSRTPTGRATIAVLEINLPLRVAFRQTLIEEGVFPPT